MVALIWATRGRSWGFRFLLDGGQPDPLSAYDSAFVGAENEATLCRRSGKQLALRFPDPLSRTDAAGRIIPHDFVLAGLAINAINTVADGVRTIWPLVADVYAEVWGDEKPPSVAAIQESMIRRERA